MNILITITAFIVAISLLIAVHEFGHYWVAKKLGVKILRFSIGFGKPIWKKTIGADKTEFVIASLPLGGYVKMLDKREGEVDPADTHREFTQQSVWTRIAIVVAGPAFNFIFAILAYALMFVIGVTGVKPIIGNIDKNGLAEQAGLISGYEIISVNNNITPIWDVAVQNIIPAMIDRTQVSLEIKDKDGLSITRSLDFTATTGEIKVERLFDELGFKPWRPVTQPVVGQVVENSPAAKAGFKVNDKIVKINNQDVFSWNEVVKLTSASPNQMLSVFVLRNGTTINLKVIPNKIIRDGKTVGQMGIGYKAGASYPDDMRITHSYGLFESIPKGLGRTWDNCVLTMKMLGKIVTGEVSVKNLSGPVNIAVYAGYSANAGFARFLEFLAIVSTGLAIFNMLPVPVLDGGHLMFYIVEIFRRKPVSEEMQGFATQIGVALLILLMVVVVYNDILRVFG